MAPTSLPPGFRFHPTDEELVDYYLKRKVHGEKIELEVIPEIDLYKCEPWDLPGYWKATGKDRKVSSHMHYIGMKKTLVFYRGRAPHGFRTNWIMHEYRLDEKQCEGSTYVEDAYSLCRVFKRSGPEPKYGKQHDEINSLYNDIYTVPQELSLVKFEEIDQTNSLIPSESSSEMMTDIAVANRWLHFGADEIESCNIYKSPNESTNYRPNVDKKSGFKYEHSVAVPSEIEGHARFFEQYNSPAVEEEEDMVEQMYRDAEISQSNKYANQLGDFPSEIRSLESYEKKPNIVQEQENVFLPLCTQDLEDDNLVGLLDMEKQLPFF